MRPRTELALALATVAVFGLAAAWLAGPDRRLKPDERASTLLTGPGGASGVFEATRALGVDVRRQRHPMARLALPDSGTRTLLAILDPSAPIGVTDRARIDRFRTQGDLLLAGPNANALMRCFGYRVELRPFDSLPVRDAALHVHAILQRTGERVATDSSRAFDTGAVQCSAPAYARVTPLLTTAKGVVAVRLEPADSSGRILLVADVGLFRNRSVRRHDSDAGPFAVGLLTSGYDEVRFDEYHHGFGAAGSLTDEVLAWSGRSPWGWAAWQLAIVGLLALLVGAVRFGPVRARLTERRRDPREHLEALATALSAARGHDEAIAAIVRGLRRRLTPSTMRPRGDWRRWLLEQDATTTSREGRTALATLTQLTTPGQPASSVLQAAHAAEALWQSMRT